MTTFNNSTPEEDSDKLDNTMNINGSSYMMMMMNNYSSISNDTITVFNNLSECITIRSILLRKKEWTLLTTVRITFIALYFVIFVLGLMGNIAMIYTIAKRKRFNNVANIFLMNLGVCDVVLCLTAVPLAPLIHFRLNWPFGVLSCKILPFTQTTCVIVAQLSLCSIAYDRFRNIVHPQETHWTTTIARAITIGNWLFAFVFNSPLMFVYKMKPMSGLCGNFCLESWDDLGAFNQFTTINYKQCYAVMLLVVTYGIPLALQSFCFVRIFIKVQQDMIKDPHNRSRSPKNQRAGTRKRRVMYTLIMMVFGFAILWLPSTISNVMRDWNLQLAFLRYQPIFYQLCAHAFAMICVIWNPTFYFWMSKTHRRALRTELLCRWCPTLWRTSSNTMTSTSALGINRTAMGSRRSIKYNNSIRNDDNHHHDVDSMDSLDDNDNYGVNANNCQRKKRTVRMSTSMADHRQLTVPNENRLRRDLLGNQRMHRTIEAVVSTDL